VEIAGFVYTARRSFSSQNSSFDSLKLNKTRKNVFGWGGVVDSFARILDADFLTLVVETMRHLMRHEDCHAAKGLSKGMERCFCPKIIGRQRHKPYLVRPSLFGAIAHFARYQTLRTSTV
jgi:hypothetical protein